MKRTLLALLCLCLPLLAGDEGSDGVDQARKRIADRFLERHDTDGDGLVSAAEFPQGGRLKFEDADRNGDGFLDGTEVGRMFDRGRRRGGRGGAGRAPGPEQIREMAARIMKRLDKDADGKLVGDEIPADAQGRLDLSKADRNEDGGVDLFEVTIALTERMRARGGDQPGRGGRDAGRMLKQMDRNGDGSIDEAEWRGPAEAFARVDADGDGVISADELTRAAKAMRGRGDRGDRGGRRIAQRLKQLDADGDGSISADEFKGPEPMFKRLDQDQDGRISAGEIEAASKAAGRWRGRAGEAFFRRLDANEDGKIAADEWKQRPELFQRLDANGDGFITRDEVTPKGPRRGRRNRIDVRSGKDSAHFLAKYDTNRDGSVSRDEFSHERRFAEIDTDGDGVLQKTEIEEAMDKRRSEEAYGFLERYDLNADGKVTRDEFTGPAMLFERMDRNHDGIIDATDQPDK